MRQVGGFAFDTKRVFRFCSQGMTANSLGQLLLVGVPGPELDAKTAAIYRRLQPGGFILFGRNIQSPEQLRKLLDDLRDLAAEEPILTIDQEGGRVSRLRLIGEEPPNARQLSRHGEPSCITRHGQLTAELLRLFGFNLDLCPVLDISFDEEADNSLKGRCYGSSVGEVIRNAGLFNAALRKGGILSCGKHFPGYTFAGLDPHEELPSVARSRTELEECELAVFRALLADLDSMMIGHIAFPALDPSGTPASLSPILTQQLLRDELGFSGLIMTDDLDMGAILNHYGFAETMRMGLAAGNDLLMLCHRVELAPQVVEALRESPAGQVDRALENITRFRSKFASPRTFSPVEFAKINQAIWDLRVEVLGPEAAANRSVEDGKRSPVELY